MVVAGLNMIKKATKPNPQTGEGGGIIEKEAPIHASNVMILDPKTGKGTRKRPCSKFAFHPPAFCGRMVVLPRARGGDPRRILRHDN